MSKTLSEHTIAALWETITGARFSPGSKAEEFARAIEREVLATQQPEPRDESADWNTPCAGCSTPRACQHDGCRSEPRDEVTDTERLDWLIAQQAWIQWTMRDGSIRQCQVYDQDEDENYHILSGDGRYFNTPREAIDAARAGASHE